MSSSADFLVKSWYRSALWLYLLLPFTLFYRLVIAIRKAIYQRKSIADKHEQVPVIVVGNITVGGTGKTPVVIALVEYLQQLGFKPGVISRGYGSSAPSYPYKVTTASPIEHSGDEPALIVQRTQVPLVIDPVRSRGLQVLSTHYQCDVVVSDDGLQHYALGREFEIVVVDGQRLFGNGHCLPMGPLREPLARLRSVDYIIINGGESRSSGAHLASGTAQSTMELTATQLESLDGKHSVEISQWRESRTVHAVAGIGNPQRFYATLAKLGFDVIEHSFPDHHVFGPEDFAFEDGRAVIMTEKDAVKARAFTGLTHCWYLPVTAQIDAAFYQTISDCLNTLSALSSKESL